jgi:hypothetical protein
MKHEYRFHFIVQHLPHLMQLFVDFQWFYIPNPLPKKIRELTLPCPPPAPRHPKNQCFHIFSPFFLCRDTVTGVESFFPSHPWPLCSITRRPLPVVEHFRCSCPLKGPCDVRILGATPRISETAKYETVKGEGWLHSVLSFIIRV